MCVCVCVCGGGGSPLTLRIHPPHNVANDDGTVFKFQLQDKRKKEKKKGSMKKTKSPDVMSAAPLEEYALWIPITGAVFESQTKKMIIDWWCIRAQ